MEGHLLPTDLPPACRYACALSSTAPPACTTCHGWSRVPALILRAPAWRARMPPAVPGRPPPRVTHCLPRLHTGSAAPPPATTTVLPYTYSPLPAAGLRRLPPRYARRRARVPCLPVTWTCYYAPPHRRRTCTPATCAPAWIRAAGWIPALRLVRRHTVLRYCHLHFADCHYFHGPPTSPALHWITCHTACRCLPCHTATTLDFPAHLLHTWCDYHLHCHLHLLPGWVVTALHCRHHLGPQVPTTAYTWVPATCLTALCSIPAACWISCHLPAALHLPATWTSCHLPSGTWRTTWVYRFYHLPATFLRSPGPCLHTCPLRP